MELPEGINPFCGVLMEHYEENKIQSPLDEGQGESPKPKRPKKAKASESPKARKAAEPGRETGHWNGSEKRKYHWFLEIYHSHFENKHMRRMDKIFKTMADFLGSRAADQCRSHHQKMEKKFKHFYSIIYNLRLLHYGVPGSAELLAELRQLGLCIEDGLISEAQLDLSLQQKEDQHQEAQLGQLPQPSKPLRDLDAPKWDDHPF